MDTEVASRCVTSEGTGDRKDHSDLAGQQENNGHSLRLRYSRSTPRSTLATTAVRHPLVYFAVAAAAGILLNSTFTPSAWLWISSFFIFAIVTLFGPASARPFAAVLLLMPPAALRHSFQQASYDAATVHRLIADAEIPVVADGIIDRPPRLRPHPLAEQRRQQNRSPWQTQWEMTLQRIRDGSSFRPVTGRALVTVDGKQDELLPGDVIRVFGSISHFEPPMNPGEPDLRKIYRRRRLHVRINVDIPDQVTLKQANRLNPARPIALIARSARDTLLDHLGSTSGPLAVALVIGQRDFVPTSMRDRLLATGTAHLLSVSGLHLAIIVLIARAFGLMLRLPKHPMILWLLSVTLLYVAITGGRPPVVRAAILVGVVALSFLFRRPAQPLNTLSLAAIVLMFWNPENLFSIGVHLSFLAVATLLVGATRGISSVERTLEQQRNLDLLIDSSRSRLDRYTRWTARGAANALWYSGCVTAIALPLVWHQFNIVSPISIVTNVIVGPLMFGALAAGVATVALGWLTGPLAAIPAFACDGFLQIINAVIAVASEVPAGHFWLPSPPTWLVVCFYAGLLATFLLPRQSEASRDRQAISPSLLRYGLIVVWLPIAWWRATTPAPLAPGHLEATFVDVGHGTSVVLRSGNEVWLYDCGRLGNERGSSRGINETLWSLRVSALTGVVLSHADADHFNALPGLLRRFPVTQIITPPDMLLDPEPAIEPLREAIRSAGIPVRELTRGVTFDGLDHPVTVLHPPDFRIAEGDNANSLVLRIDCGGVCLLLPGDLEPPGTQMLVRQPRLPAGSVLMAPHHGSLSADTEPMLGWARPLETIVSGGDRARQPAVREALAVTGSGVHVTAELGAIRVRIDPAGGVDVRSWTVDRW